ncbi:MafI family immunity protein [Hyalangium versicolor]|uniref:MafI family immunity protein n=1 Tax=Hyalangium versicolor TaxID=2861190 RepID=UPI001CCBD74A|nr:MafI family immunity protein [Hyalangium versicolor]
MGLAKKGTRLLTVEGVRYRWRVTSADEPGLGIVVEDADSPGQRMVTWVDHGQVISPWVVREAILHALSQGWQPQTRGPDLTFRFESSNLQSARHERRTSQLLELCDELEDRVQGLEDVREFVEYGERVIAFETLCDRIIHTDKAPTLSLSEFEELAAIGEEFGCPFDWISLILYLSPEDREQIPEYLRNLAAKNIPDALARSLTRKEWLERIRELFNPPKP